MRPKINALIILFTCLAFNISAQQLSPQWAQRLGGQGWDYVNAMVVDSSGNYIIGGSLKGTLQGDTTKPSLAYSNNAYLASFDTSGKILWQKTFGGTMFDNITSMASTPHGVLIAGIFQDTLHFEKENVNTTAFTGAYFALVNTEGNPLWLRQTGGLATIRQIGVCSDSKGNAYLAGTFADSLQLAGEISLRVGDKGFFITTLLPDGSESKPYVFKGTGNCTLGDFRCSNSLLCLAGSFSNTLTIGDTTLISVGDDDAFVALFTRSGKLKHLITTCGTGNEQIRAVAFSPEGRLGITGTYDNSILMQDQILQTTGGKDIFVAVIDTAGKLEWLKSIGGHGNDYGYAITANASGGFYVSGNFAHNLQMQDENGNLVDMDASSPFGNAFIAKYNAEGELKASYNLPASSEDYCQSLIVDNNRMITTVGNFYQTIQLPGHYRDTIKLETEGERDIFFLRFKDLCEGVTVDAGSDTVLCPGETLYLTSPEPYLFYKWLPGGKPNQDLGVNQPGTYKLLITDRNGCIAADSLNIKLLELPVVYAGRDTTIAAGTNLVLQKASVANVKSVEWRTQGNGYYDNNASLSTYYSPSYSDILNGSVILSLAGSNQCVTKDDNLLLTIMQDNDGITVYPNPTQGLVTLICTKGMIIKRASIATPAGTVIQSNIIVNGTVLQYDLSEYPPGTFLFHLFTDTTTLTKTINKL